MLLEVLPADESMLFSPDIAGLRQVLVARNPVPAR